MERKQRLFLVACCRRIWPLLADERSRHAVEVAERYADRAAGRSELRTAYDGAARAYAEVRRTSEARAYCAACPAAEVARVDFRGGFDICTYGAEVAAMAPAARQSSPDTLAGYNEAVRGSEDVTQTGLLRDIFGNPPFRPPAVGRGWLAWNAGAVGKLARTIYNDRRFDRLPVLADALEDAGCQNPEILAHCRGRGEHVPGCWVVDLLLWKR